MTNLDRLKVRIGPDDQGNYPDDGTLNDCLDTAKAAILNRRYPFGDWPVDEETGEAVLEARYSDLQVRCAVDVYNKKGAEGETAHSENGISRSYESAWVSETLLQEVTPFAGVIR